MISTVPMPIFKDLRPFLNSSIKFSQTQNPKIPTSIYMETNSILQVFMEKKASLYYFAR